MLIFRVVAGFPATALILGLLCLLPACTPLPEYQAPPPASRYRADLCPAGQYQRLQSLLDAAINRHGLVGAQLSLRVGERPPCTLASGTIDLKRRQPMRTDDLIRLGSITKTFTAVVAKPIPFYWGLLLPG